jgi:hypothetical protein
LSGSVGGLFQNQLDFLLVFLLVLGGGCSSLLNLSSIINTFLMRGQKSWREDRDLIIFENKTGGGNYLGGFSGFRTSEVSQQVGVDVAISTLELGGSIAQSASNILNFSFTEDNISISSRALVNFRVADDKQVLNEKNRISNLASK